MKLTGKYFRKVIKEEVEGVLNQYWDVEDPVDVEPLEDAWAGGDDLVNPIDHSDAVGSEKVTAAPEVMDITERIWRNLWRLKKK